MEILDFRMLIYPLLGPYFEMKAKQEVEEEDFPFHHPLGQAVDR